MKRIFTVAIFGLAALAGRVFADDTGTSTVSITVGAEAAFTSVGATSLTKTGTTFADYTGTTSFGYKIRTSQTTGGGFIKLQVTSDFGSGGPSGDTLVYSSTVGSGGTNVTNQTASTTAQTNVATYGADAHSSDGGDSGSVSWTLTNKPSYKTGSYSATVTFTISAT